MKRAKYQFRFCPRRLTVALKITKYFTDNPRVPLYCHVIKHSKTSGRVIVYRTPTTQVWGSILRLGYIEKSSCVNEFSDVIEDTCYRNIMQDLITKDEDTLESSCRFQIELRDCRVESTKERCGTVAADILRRLLIYQYEYDFKCPLIEEKTEAISSLAVPSSTDSSDNTNEPSEKVNNRREGFHPRENTKRETYPKERLFETFSNEMDDLSLDFAHTNKNNNFLKAEKILDVNADFKKDASSNVAGITNEAEMGYFSKPNGDLFENEAKSTASDLGFYFIQKPTESLDSQQTNCYFASSGTKTFGLYEILVERVKYHGCGAATILWARDSLLKNVFCSWSSAEESEKPFKCSIHIDEACSLKRNFLKENTYDTLDITDNHRTLNVYVYENERYTEIATIKVNYFKSDKNSLPASTCIDSNDRSKHINFQRAARRVGSLDSSKSSNEQLDAVSGHKKERVVATDSESLRDLWYYLKQSIEETTYEQFEELVTDFSTELSTVLKNTIDLVEVYLFGQASSSRPPSPSLYPLYKLFRPNRKDPSDTKTKTLRLKRYVPGQLDSDRYSSNNKIFKSNDEKVSAVHDGYCSKKTPCSTAEGPDKCDITKTKQLRRGLKRNVLGKPGNHRDCDEGVNFKSKDETFSNAHNGYRSKDRPCSTTSSTDKLDIKPGMLLNFAHIKAKEMEFYEGSTPSSLHTAKRKYILKGKPIDHNKKIKLTKLLRRAKSHDSGEF
ncbi:hypothetical protein TNCV_426681 [Trichonephila clavipes]|nr:hypothetical protein TNCV_426681 [Trichonephila clavipes]